MAYLKRTAAFQWAGQTVTFDKQSQLLELNAERVKNKFRMHNNEVYERRLVYKIQLCDVEDPEIYAAQPILDWKETEHGQWVMTHGLDPTFRIIADYMTYGYVINVTAHIAPKRWTEYCLKFDKYVF